MMPRLKKEVRTKNLATNNKKLILRIVTVDHLSSFGFVISSAFYNVVMFNHNVAINVETSTTDDELMG